VFVFRGWHGDIAKVLWFDGDGLCLLAKRLERAALRGHRLRVVQWSSISDSCSLLMLLEGIDWRAPLGPAHN